MYQDNRLKYVLHYLVFATLTTFKKYRCSFVNNALLVWLITAVGVYC